MSVQVWLLFCATDTVLCFTPGPAVLLVVSQALARGLRAGLSASLGILTANIAYFGLVPEYIGRRLGYFFLYHTAMNAWAKPISKLLVNTCTLDQPGTAASAISRGPAPTPRPIC